MQQGMISVTDNMVNPLIPEQKRVLVVEDEAEIRQLIVLHLRREGFQVDEASDGRQARSLIGDIDYDLLILDWMIPGLSGLELTRYLRARPGAWTPILFVTARTEPEHVATALDAGADDYLAKPFDTLVLMARVNALLRRKDWVDEAKSSGKANDIINIEGLRLDIGAYEAWIGDQKLDLTRSEFKLLECLMMNQGRVLTREALIGEIQGENVNVVGRTVDTHVFGLRKKLGAQADLIETIRGVGYRVRNTTSHT